MRKLTRTEIESGGSAMPRIMKFHDQLLGSRLRRVATRSMSHPQEPPVLMFDQSATVSTQFDDEGNPGATEWVVTDLEGFIYEPVEIVDLVGQSVSGIGYLHDPENDCRSVIPCLEIARTFLICCMTPHGGGVIHHFRPRDDRWDLFCQFTPKLT